MKIYSIYFVDTWFSRETRVDKVNTKIFILTKVYIFIPLAFSIYLSDSFYNTRRLTYYHTKYQYQESCS